MRSETPDGSRSLGVRLRDQVARKPSWLIWPPAIAGIGFAAVADVMDGEGFDLWLWVGTVATVWALALAIGIWLLTAADTSKVLAHLAAQDAKIEGQRKQLVQLSMHRGGAVTTPRGHVIGGPPVGQGAQTTKFDVSLLEGQLLDYLQARTGVTRDQIKDGEKVYDTGSPTDPWVVTAKDGREWLVTLRTSGSGGVVSELFTTNTSRSSPGDG